MICVKINSSWLRAMKRQAQRGRRTSSGKLPCTTSPVKKLVWFHILHSLASHQKSCPQRPTRFLRKEPKCCTCLMRPFLAGCTSDCQSSVSNNANKRRITSLYTQALTSPYYSASLVQMKGGHASTTQWCPLPNSHGLFIKPSEGAISSDQE